MILFSLVILFWLLVKCPYIFLISKGINMRRFRCSYKCVVTCMHAPCARIKIVPLLIC